jgi:hypothetical protein
MGSGSRRPAPADFSGLWQLGPCFTARNLCREDTIDAGIAGGHTVITMHMSFIITCGNLGGLAAATGC